MAAQKTTKTKTSAFGSPGRISHDARSFYASRLYEGMPAEEAVDYVQTPFQPLPSITSIAPAASRCRTCRTTVCT